MIFSDRTQDTGHVLVLTVCDIHIGIFRQRFNLMICIDEPYYTEYYILKPIVVSDYSTLIPWGYGSE